METKSVSWITSEQNGAFKTFTPQGDGNKGSMTNDSKSYETFKTFTPQGDGNLDYWAKKSLFHFLLKPLPRKGMETVFMTTTGSI